MTFKTTAKHVRSTLAATGLAALVALGAAVAPVTQAQAAVVVGAFDPVFGPSIPNMGYRGTATFVIEDSCFATIATVFANSGCIGSGDFFVQQMTLELYNVLTPGRPTIASFTLPSPLNNNAMPALLSATIGFSSATNRNELIGVETDFGVILGAVVDDDIAAPNGVQFFGTFYLGFRNIFATDQGVVFPSQARLLACDRNDIRCTVNTATEGTRANTVFGTRDGGPPNAVPEPSAIGLSLLALAAAAAASRRRFKS